MKYIKHPKHDLFIGKPLNWDEAVQGPCGALSVHTYVDKGLQTMESAWEPEDVYAGLRLAIGEAQVRLGIVGQYQHPVVYMSTVPIVSTQAEKTLRYKDALNALIELAKAEGVTLSLEEDGTARAISWE